MPSQFWATEKMRREQKVRDQIMRRLEILEKLLEQVQPERAQIIRELIPYIRAAVNGLASLP